MKISELIAKLKGVDPEQEVTPEDLVADTKPEEDNKSEDNKDSEQSASEPPEDAEPSPVEPEKQPDDSSAVDILLQKQAELEAKLADMAAQNESLQRQKAEADAKSKLDKALAEGWLLPAMLEEAEGVPSVFVDLAKNEPEIFDRFKLVMAPKVFPKPIQTDVSADINGMSEDKLVAKVKAIAAEKGISYADATKLI